jgi:MFS transporter, DHA1 family, tetracycline resistance protein
MAVFVDVLGLSLALPVLTIIFTSDNSFAGEVSDAVKMAYLSIALALNPLFMFFGSSFMGDLSDIIGRKQVLAICMGGFVIGFAMMGVGSNAYSLTLIFGGRALSGLSAASLATTLAAIADMSNPEDKASNMSLVVLFQSLGLVLGPLVGGVLSDNTIISFFSPGLAFYVASGLALIAFLWIVLSYQDTKKPNAKKHLHPLRIVMVFVEVAKHAKVRLLTLSFLLQQLAMALFLQLSLVYLAQYFNYSGFMLGMYNVFLGVMTCLGVFVVPKLSKKVRSEWLAFLFIGLMGLSELIVPLVSHIETFMWIIAILMGIFGIVAWTTILTSFSNAAGDHEQGWALGITGSIVALSFFLGGFAPNLAPIIGIPAILGIGGALAIIAALIFLYYCLKKLPAEQAQEKP